MKVRCVVCKKEVSLRDVYAYVVPVQTCGACCVVKTGEMLVYVCKDCEIKGKRPIRVYMGKVFTA